MLVTHDEYIAVNKRILSEYQKIKNELPEDETIISEYLGVFTQDILIQMIASIKESFNHKVEVIGFEKRLSYFVIECIQNVIFHSNKQSKTNQEAYIIVTKDKNENYSISSANSLETDKIPDLEKKIDSFLSLKSEILSKLFMQKIQTPVINDNNHGGLGLITMINKSGKGFRYHTSKVFNNYSIFHIQLKLHHKINK